MFPEPKNLTPWIALILISGCDDRATQIAREAADRQAQQNTEMARLNREVAAGSHELVEADARARKEIVGVHHDLQAERSQLNTSWDDLERERQQLTRERRTESMLGSAAEITGVTIVVALLLGFCWHLLIALRRDTATGAQLSEFLIQELLADEPLKLSVESRLTSIPDLSAKSHPSDG